MFDLSLAEILLIIVVAVVFIQPKDLPMLVKSIAKAIKTLRDFGHDIKQTFEDISKESGITDVKETLDAEMRLIKGDDGKIYEAYQVPQLEKDVKKHDDREK